MSAAFTDAQLECVRRVRAELRTAEEALIQGILTGRISAETMAVVHQRTARASQSALEYPFNG